MLKSGFPWHHTKPSVSLSPMKATSNARLYLEGPDKSSIFKITRLETEFSLLFVQV